MFPRRIACGPTPGPSLVAEHVQNRSSPADGHVESIGIALVKPFRPCRHIRTAYKAEQNHVAFPALKAIGRI